MIWQCERAARERRADKAREPEKRGMVPGQTFNRRLVAPLYADGGPGLAWFGFGRRVVNG
jgi:hypothetical protein